MHYLTPVSFLVALLALDAARGGRLGEQPLEADRGAAVGADAVGAVVDAPACGLDRAQLSVIARQVGLVQVDEEVGDPLVADVGRALFAQPRGVAFELVEEGLATLLERATQLIALPGFHAHSVAPPTGTGLIEIKPRRARLLKVV